MLAKRMDCSRLLIVVDTHPKAVSCSGSFRGLPERLKGCFSGGDLVILCPGRSNRPLSDSFFSGLCASARAQRCRGING